MSATTDKARAATAHEVQNETARARLALAARISALSYEGLTVPAMAERLGVPRRTIERWRAVLGWQRLRGAAWRSTMAGKEAHRGDEA